MQINNSLGTKNKETELTKDWPDPVLMLSPPGPLADRARAMMTSLQCVADVMATGMRIAKLDAVEALFSEGL